MRDRSPPRSPSKPGPLRNQYELHTAMSSISSNNRNLSNHSGDLKAKGIDYVHNGTVTYQNYQTSTVSTKMQPSHEKGFGITSN
jgi:hypothetical protein